MTNIAIVIPSIRFGLRYWNYILEALEKRGLSVTVYTSLAGQSSSKIKIVNCEGKLITLRRNSDGYDRTLLLPSSRLIREIVRKSPDVVIAVEYTITSFYAYLGARACGARFVIFQEHSSRHRFQLGLIKKLWRRMLLRVSDLVIANTRSAMEEIVGLCPSCREKAKLVPLLVPPNRSDLMKKELGFPKGSLRPIFAYVGQLIPGKNVGALLEAAEILKRKGYTFSIWIVGDGPERRSLESIVTSKGLEDRIWFLGGVPYESMGFVYSETDVLVMPTLSDYRSVAVLEAVRFGKPVIDSSNDGNAGDTVRHGINGWIVDPLDRMGLVRAMESFIRDRGLIRTMGMASEQALKDLTPESAAKRLVESILEARVRSD